MKGPEDIEIFVKVNETEHIVSFLNEMIGTLTFCSEIDDGYVLYICNEAKILINDRIQDGYVSVYLKGVEKWSSDVEFARDIAEKLGLRVRCDPGSDYPAVSPYSDTFIEVSLEGEHLVQWH